MRERLCTCMAAMALMFFCGYIAVLVPPDIGVSPIAGGLTYLILFMPAIFWFSLVEGRKFWPKPEE